MNVATLSQHPSRFDARSNPTVRRGMIAFSASALLAGLCLLQSGCVALCIPSQRHYDPEDSGGLLGTWKKPLRPGHRLQEFLEEPCSEPSGCDGALTFAGDSATACAGEFADESDFQSGLYGQAGSAPEAPKPPEVPWPKYHPVPTRPVFGG